MNATFVTRFVLLAALVLASGAVRADVVRPPPTECPPGAIGETSHGGPHCVAYVCERGCKAGTSCQSMGLCIEKRHGGSIDGPFEFEAVAGVCAAGGKCERGTCVTLKVCAPSKPAPAPAMPKK